MVPLPALILLAVALVVLVLVLLVPKAQRIVVHWRSRARGAREHEQVAGAPQAKRKSVSRTADGEAPAAGPL